MNISLIRRPQVDDVTSSVNEQRNWVFDTNSDFLITISLEPNLADLRYFKLWILLDQIIWVWNIKGLQHRVLKILRFKYLILLQRLNSFSHFLRDLYGVFTSPEFPLYYPNNKNCIYDIEVPSDNYTVKVTCDVFTLQVSYFYII